MRSSLPHGNAHTPFCIVELIRELHENGLIGYKRLSKVFGVSVRTVRGYLTYSVRVSR